MSKNVIAAIRRAFITHPVPSPKDVDGERYWDERNAIERVLSQAEVKNGNK